MKLKIKEVKKIVDEATEHMRSWAYKDQQIILTRLNEQIMYRLDKLKENK